MPRPLVTTNTLNPDRLVRIGWLAGVAEVASFFTVSPTTVSNWAYRRSWNDMPQPVTTLRSGTFYDLSDLIPWWVDWKPVKGARAGAIDWTVAKALGLEELAQGAIQRGVKL